MEQRDKGLATVAGAHEPRGVRSAPLRARRRPPHASGAARAVASRCASPRTSLSTAPGLQMLARKSMESSVTGGWRELGMAERMPQGGLPLVLLAGDGQEGTRWLRVLLEGGGYAVLQERTAQHALERARTTEPDVILVDAELPDMAGVELCRMLRTDSRISSSTPILLTIRDAATRVQRLAALRAGAWECIAPPHDADEILLKIGAYVHAKLDADRARAGGLLDPVTGLYNRQARARRAPELGSQAFREHGPLACVVLALDIEPPEPGAAQQQRGTSLARYVQAIKSAARLSDVIGRLSATEFAVLAPGTDAEGARRLAERLASSGSATTVAPARAPPAVRGRRGHQARAKVRHAAVAPVGLFGRAGPGGPSRPGEFPRLRRPLHVTGT